MAGSELLVLNPRRRKSRRSKATHKRRRRRRSTGRHLAMNPRRHSRRRRSNPRRRRSVRHNPGRNVLGIPINQVVALAAGGFATEVLANKLASMLPAAWKTDANLVRIGTKAAIGVGVPLLARRFLPRGWGNALAVGGGVVTLLDILKTYVAPNIPGLTLTGYEIGPMGESNAVISNGLSEFTQGGLGDSPYTDSVYGTSE